MFDIGFLEILIISVVALLVFGPEKLPELARNIGLWVGRIRRFADNMKSDIDKELRLHELQESMKSAEQEGYKMLEDTKSNVDLSKDVASLEDDAADKPHSKPTRDLATPEKT